MRIGMFFVVDGVLISDSFPVEQGQGYGDHIEHGEHYDYWLSLVPTTSAEAAFKSHAYDYYPRGRAVYDVNHSQVKLYVVHCIDAAALTTIKSALALPGDARLAMTNTISAITAIQCSWMIFMKRMNETLYWKGILQ